MAAGTAITTSFPTQAARATGQDADLVIHNGKVLVLDNDFRQASAVAIRDGRVLAVGTDRSLRRYRGARTAVINAGGGTVLPGINDSHNHLASLGLSLPPYAVDVNTTSIADLVEIVRRAVDEAPAPASWIRCRGWQELRLPRAPRAADIDPVSGEHPVILRDNTGHATSVNSVVMRMASITRDTVAPPGGVIHKDANGEPTGVFLETAQDLVNRIVPAFTQEERSHAIDVAIGLLHSFGITSATEPGTGGLGLYAARARASRLPLRLTMLLSAGSTPATLRNAIASYLPPDDIDPRILRVTGVKIFADGIPRQRTAWMHRPYLDGTNGSLTVGGATHEEQLANLHEMIRIATAAEFQIGTHACGDATIDATVAGYVDALGRDGRSKDLRHYVIHCNFPSARTLRQMSFRGIGANMNAEIQYLQGRILEPIIGPELTDYQRPYRSLLRAGISVATGSDAPVASFNWLRGALCAVLRVGEDGSSFGPSQRISMPAALDTYTRGGARQDHADTWKGTLEPGMAADVCIIDGDLLTPDPYELLDMRVSTTILGGDVVYDRADEQSREMRAATAAVARMDARRRDHGGHDDLCCCQLAEQISKG